MVYYTKRERERERERERDVYIYIYNVCMCIDCQILPGKVFDIGGVHNINPTPPDPGSSMHLSEQLPQGSQALAELLGLELRG